MRFQEKAPKYLFNVSMACFLIGLFPILRRSGTADYSKVELSLGLLSPLFKYIRYNYKTGDSNFEVYFQLISWSMVFVVIGVILLIYRKGILKDLK